MTREATAGRDRTVNTPDSESHFQGTDDLLALMEAPGSSGFVL